MSQLFPIPDLTVKPALGILPHDTLHSLSSVLNTKIDTHSDTISLLFYFGHQHMALSGLLKICMWKCCRKSMELPVCLSLWTEPYTVCATQT